MNETISIIEGCINTGKSIQHVCVNASKLVALQKNRELKQSVVNADIVNADGQAVVWASKFLGFPLPERVAGIDLMIKLVDLASKNGYKCYFLGSKEDVVKSVVNHYQKKYSSDIIAGYRNGYFSAKEESGIVNEIAKSGAHILFVAMSSPKKEVFLSRYKEDLKVPFIMGVGGSFDVISGVTKRAPFWMQRIGMEWFFRFMQEPRRMFIRYFIGNFKFIGMVLKCMFMKKN
nr:WecB/TagA/CpsF family glycosyltransferase [uncultured Carboxylicivirga sp.]